MGDHQTEASERFWRQMRLETAKEAFFLLIPTKRMWITTVNFKVHTSAKQLIEEKKF